jgi:4-hydroxybenzoate polyprenyltransferase
MNAILAFFKLIRWPNLVFIGLTQILFYFCVFQTLSQESWLSTDNLLFYLLVLASLFIAAAGYIINDYFDLRIDAVNKPQKVVVDKIVKRRWAIILHWVFSAVGILISSYISYRIGSWVIALCNAACVLLLWFYSTTFKRKLLSGNVIVASLTAWVILVVYFFCGANLLVLQPENYTVIDKNIFKFTVLYSGFAFMVSLIREVVKDIEDMKGDALYNCRTMPIVWGVPTTKVFTAVWLVVCICSLFIVQLYVWNLGWWLISVYTDILVILPLLYVLRKLYKASTVSNYRQLSGAIKLVMLAGILSMLFFIFI